MSENRHGFHQQSRSTIDDHQATHRLHLLQSFQAEVAPLGTVRERGELHVAEHLSAGVIAWLAQFRHIPVAAGAEVVGPDDLLLSGYPVGDHQARNLVLDAQALATVGGTSPVRPRRPSAAHHGAEHRADRAAGGLRQCVHTPCPAAASPDGSARQAIAHGQEPSHVRVSAVRFTPSARSAWRTHAAGQALSITDGHGLHQPPGGKTGEIRAGAIVCTPAGERHRHRATPGHFMTHLPIIEAVPGGRRPEANRGEHVTDEEYYQS